jgi:hypothetical protein
VGSESNPPYALAHPPDLVGFDWTEQFANMGENWILGDIDPANFGFASNEYGDALEGWMNNHMPALLGNLGYGG